MDLYKKFATDSSVETGGIILDYGGGCRIRVRRAGGANKDFTRAIERETRTHRFQIQTGRLSGEENLEIMADVYAKTIVLGWEGVADKDGKPLPFSVEACVKLFTDLPDLFADVMTQTQNAALFLAQLDEADGKN